jgi:hypothetical protein
MDDLMRPAMPRPKPVARIVDKNARPLDEMPLLIGTCPSCGRFVGRDLSRHHVVPKGQGGDDVPENLIWVCGDGTRGCHGVLTHRGRGDHGLTFDEVAAALLEYVDTVPPIREYADRAKYVGFLDAYYRGGRSEVAA